MLLSITGLNDVCSSVPPLSKMAAMSASLYEPLRCVCWNNVTTPWLHCTYKTRMRPARQERQYIHTHTHLKARLAQQELMHTETHYWPYGGDSIASINLLAVVGVLRRCTLKNSGKPVWKRPIIEISWQSLRNSGVLCSQYVAQKHLMFGWLNLAAKRAIITASTAWPPSNHEHQIYVSQHLISKVDLIADTQAEGHRYISWNHI